MLNVVSLAHRAPSSEALHLALFRPEFPVLGGSSRLFGSVDSVREHCSGHLNSRWRGRAPWRDGAPNSRELRQPRESCVSPERAASAPRELRQPRESCVSPERAASAPRELRQPRESCVSVSPERAAPAPRELRPFLPSRESCKAAPRTERKRVL